MAQLQGFLRLLEVKRAHHRLETGQKHLSEHLQWSKIICGKTCLWPFFDPKVTLFQFSLFETSGGPKQVTAGSKRAEKHLFGHCKWPKKKSGESQFSAPRGPRWTHFSSSWFGLRVLP